MKAEELMIGDWVMNKYQERAFRILNVGENHVGEKHSDGMIEGHKEQYLKPIPLTPEILEKNGFEKVYDKYKLPNYRIKWNSYTDLYFTVFTGVDGYWNPIGLNVITGGLTATVDYVHQLQHALKLCGIDKEFVL